MTRRLALLLTASAVVSLTGCGGKPQPEPAAGGGSPTAAVEGEQWTHKDLVAFLRSKGVNVYSQQSESGVLNGPAVDLIIDGGGKAVYCQKRATAADARDQAGAAGSLAFAWGRFLFVGYDHSPELARQVATALGAR